jgi:tetratricopeptide (TPR) repeat protein
MKNKTTKIFIFFTVVSVILASCQSMQKDIMLSRADEKAYGELSEIEELIIRLDGGGAGREGIANVRQKITAMQGTVADNNFEAVLAAWSGRLYLMEGKNSDAQKDLRKSQNLSPRNLPSQILSFKLERDLSKRLTLVDQSLESEGPLGELLIERGRALFDMNRFSESVTAFDTAFIALVEKPYYEKVYGAFRGKAWELRELEYSAGDKTMEIGRRSEITWKELIEITKNETDFFRFITAGRDWPAESLFAQLVERSFIPLTPDVSKTEWPYSKPSSSEIVLRSGAAWFLWRLNAENRANMGLLTRYSSRYANTSNARSPIGDLSVSSPFFDSVLGCVESEFMSLPDGRNFMPNQTVRGTEFLSMLKKL